MELFSSNITEFLIFSQEKAFLIFQETKTPKNCFIFSQEKAFRILPETETSKKFFMFPEKELFVP